MAMDSQERFPSKVPKRNYASTKDEQLRQLRSDGLLQRFAGSREKLSSDRYRPLYHYVNPESTLNDPNGLCYWQGQYHLFYQAYPPEDPRQHWGHAVSDDLVTWEDLPLAIYPGIEEACYSGSTLVEEDRVVAMYHGTKAGNMVAVASDPLLLNWEKIEGNPVIPLVEPDAMGRPYRVFDPCIWREEEGYYALSGSYGDGQIFEDCRAMPHLFFSQDLRRWAYLGPFLEGDIFTAPGEDCAVPYFWPIGDKRVLVFASHQRGSQYLVGDYDKLRHRFRPSAHGRFNFGAMEHGGVHAPSATPDGSGGLWVVHNVNHGRPPEGWNHVMSLVRRLTLRSDDTLNIEPVPAIEKLRTEHLRVGETQLPVNREVEMSGIRGDSMELAIEIDSGEAREVSVDVLRSPGGEERTAITFLSQGGMRKGPGWRGRERGDALVLDNSRSSLLPDVFARPPEVAPFQLEPGEPLRLRIFVDRSIVEVFANGRQSVTLRAYPSREDSTGVSVSAVGGDAKLLSLDAWRMRSIWESQG